MPRRPISSRENTLTDGFPKSSSLMCISHRTKESVGGDRERKEGNLMSDSTHIAERVRPSNPKEKACSEPVSIIMPAFNEVEIIGQVLDTIIHQMSRNGVQYELIVVDDGSTDG